MPERLPLTKLLDTPFISLDETNIEMASILFLFTAVILVAGIARRRQLWRHLVQALSVVVFFFIIYSCLGVFGMIRNGLFGVTLLGTAYSESFYWMALPVAVIAATCIAGPIFCGWICPTGTIQEVACALRRLWQRGRTPLRRPGLWLGLTLTGFFAVLVALSLRRNLFIEDSSLHWGGALLLLCYLVLAGHLDDVPTRGLRLVSLVAIFVTAISHLAITSPVHFAFTARNDPASATTTGIIFVASLFVMRAWCRYLCPWGYLMGFLHRFSRLKLSVVASRCNRCGQCAAGCDVGAIDAGIVIRQEHCQLCYHCVDTCPNRAIEVVDVWQARRAAPAVVVGAPEHAAPGPGQRD